MFMILLVNYLETILCIELFDIQRFYIIFVNLYYHCVLKLAMCLFFFEGLANFLCSFFYFTKWNLRFLFN